VRLEAHKPNKKALAVPTAHVEKDRTGVLAGQTIPWPGFDNIAKPLLGLLGTTQAAPPTDEEVGVQDAEALARHDKEQAHRSEALAEGFTARLKQAETVADLQRIGGELTAAVKARLAPQDLAWVRKVYCERQDKLKAPATVPGTAQGPGRNGS
jgi:hypothetical protein